MVHNITPLYLSSLIPQSVNTISRYNLRNSNDLQTIDARTNQFYEGISKSFEPNMERARNLDLFCFIFQRSPLPTPHTCPI